MKYRTRLTLIFIGLALFTNGITVAFMYLNVKKVVFLQIQTTALSVVATSAALVDGNLHKNISKPADEEKPEYKALWKDLRAIKDANQRKDIHIDYVYTMTQPDKKSGNLFFGVDAEDAKSKDKSHAGDEYAGDYEAWNLNSLHVDNRFTSDKWGYWLSAAAPLKDSSGKTVATLGIDMNAAGVKHSTQKILWIGLMSTALSVAFAIGLAAYFAKILSQPLLDIKKTVEAIGREEYDAKYECVIDDEFCDVGNAVNVMGDGMRQRELLKNSLVRYVSSHVAENILKSGNLPSLAGERCKITVLFADIRGFTAMSEAMPPENVVEILNEYFTKMVDQIFGNKGTLDKFIGDGLLAIFGAPLKDSEQEINAVKTAIEMQREVKKLCETSDVMKNHFCRIGIGINTGYAVVGNIGSSSRMDYTAIGDTVNIASRLESATKEFQGVDILISESTYEAVNGQFDITPRGEIALKGRLEKVKVYSVM
jgi:adenylate cyclase